MDNNNSLCNSNPQDSKFTKNIYNPISNADEILKTSVYSDYGQDWLVKETRTLQELGENNMKLRYLEKSLKSKRRIEQRNNQNQTVEEDANERYAIDKNAIISRPFPFKAEEFKYPNDDKEMPQTVYVKYSDEYGNKKPIDMELPSNN